MLRRILVGMLVVGATPAICNLQSLICNPAAAADVPVFEKTEGWSAGSNYAYHQKPGVNLRFEAGPASPAGRPSVRVAFQGAGWAEKPFERDIYLSLPTRVERRPKSVAWSVWGDGNGELVELHLRDSPGETLVWRVTVDWKGWKRVEFDGAAPSGSWGGGEGNTKGAVDPPIARVAVDIMEGKGAAPGARELAFADLSIVEETSAPGEDPLPVLAMGPTAAPPALNGRLDDACYRTAARVTELVTASGSPFKVPHRTEVFVTHDAAHLYVAYRCQDEPGRPLSAQRRPRDGAVWEDDSVELMVCPPGEAATFHHLIVNALGDIYDERWAKDPQGGGRWDGKWNAAGLRAAARADEAGGYAVEMALPLADLGAGAPEAGRPWRMNFCRMRRVGGRDDPSEASSWGGSQHFQGLDTPGWVWPAPALRVEAPAPAWKVGDNEARLRLSDPTGAGRRARVEVTVYDQGMRARVATREVDVPPGRPADVALPIPLTTGDDGGHVRIQVSDAATGTLLYRNLVRPIAVKHLFDFETDAVAYGPEEEFCRTRVHVDLSPEELVTCKLTVTWTRRATGKSVYRQVIDYFYDDPMRVAVSLALLPPGVYDIAAVLTGAGDKVLERRQFAVTRLPARAHSLDAVRKVDLGPDREIRVNGKPFFSLAVHHCRPEEYSTLKRCGFNTVPVWVGPSRDAVPAVERAWQAGLYTELGLCDLGYNWSCFVDDPQGARQRMREKVQAARAHPGLFLYQLGDELSNDRLDEFAPLYQEVKKLDPDHLQSMTTGPCWLSAEQIRKRAAVSDIVSPDLYNVGQGPLSEHPRLCDLYRQALDAVPGKALTKVPQVTGFSRVGYRLPTPAEIRYMCYADILHGAKGFSYYKWGAHSSDPGAETGLRHDYRLLSAVRQLNWEIADLSDAILSGRPVEVVRAPACGKDVELWCRRVGERTYLWAVNHSNLPQRAAVVLPGVKAGERVEVFYEDREVPAAAGGALQEELPPFGVHIYVWPGEDVFGK